MNQKFSHAELCFIESGGDNLAATFSPELADLTIYVIDVAVAPRPVFQNLDQVELILVNPATLPDAFRHYRLKFSTGPIGYCFRRTRFRSKALRVTVIVEALMASADHSGRKSKPKKG